MIIELDLNSKIPIYEQIANEIVIMISKGKLKIGESLPSVRNLADICSINPMTANKAYKILQNEGYIEINRRKGAVVSRGHLLLDEDIDNMKLSISKLFLSGMDKKEILDMINDYLEELCIS